MVKFSIVFLQYIHIFYEHLKRKIQDPGNTFLNLDEKFFTFNILKLSNNVLPVVLFIGYGLTIKKTWQQVMLVKLYVSENYFSKQVHY
jgi:hypothetical protein